MSLSTQPGDDWTQPEVEAAVSDYLVMLARELRGEDYNKAEHNRNLQALIGRSRGSIEMKHQNLSAVLQELGQPWINGYKPRGNYQELLREVAIAQMMIDRAGVQAAAQAVINAEIRSAPLPERIDEIQIEVPKPDRETMVRQPVKRESVPKLRNYLEIDSRNRALGLAGEEFVYNFEQKRLWEGGRKDLSKAVDHVAVTQGDGLGFDVKSFELDGSPRLIEVKTTSFGALTPFFVSKNELNVSDRISDRYQLYRLFNFRKQAQFFALAGSLRKSCLLEPEQFLARVG
jgi:hypothetical protein